MIERKRSIFLTGEGGTGKTHTLSVIAESMGKSLVLTATTGKATANLTNATGRRCDTIDGFLGTGITLNTRLYTDNEVIQYGRKVAQKSGFKHAQVQVYVYIGVVLCLCILRIWVGTCQLICFGLWLTP